MTEDEKVVDAAPAAVVVTSERRGAPDDLAHAAADGRPWARLGDAAVIIALGGDEATADARDRVVDKVAHVFDPRYYDVNLRAEAPRRKRFLFADMDSTIITVECVDEMARAAGVGDAVAAITQSAMRGETPFDQALRARVMQLRTLTEADLDAVWRSSVQLSPGAETLVRTMAGWGATTTLVSGGFTYFTERVAAAVGFQRHRANTLLFDDDGMLSGHVAEPILGPDAKREVFDATLAETGADASAALAVGDGANDIPMVRAAGLGAAYRAKAALHAVADVSLSQSDLSALLHIQGVHSRDFAH